jgi:copper resistance protein B
MRSAALCSGLLSSLAAASDGVPGGMGRQPMQLFIGGDRLEYQLRDDEDLALWDLQGWWGGDLNKAWLKTEGEWIDGAGLEYAELQLLYSRAIAAFWDLQLGTRYDFRPQPETAYLAFGVQGLAPYHFEVDLAAFLSEDGDLSARAEFEYDLRLSRRWLLQPRLEFNAAFSDVPALSLSRGVTDLEVGLRLRYEFRPEFAPYIGLEYSRLYGDSAREARAEQLEDSGWGLALGLRAWF